MQTSSLLFFVTAIVLTLQLGLVGLVVSPAVTVAIQILWNYLATPLNNLPGRVCVNTEEVQAEYQNLLATINDAPGEISPETRSLVNKLGELVKTAEDIVPPSQTT